MKFILIIAFIALVTLYPVGVESDTYEPYGKISLWSKIGFRGASITLQDTIYDLSKLGYNYKVKSIDVEDGAWVLYSKRYFRGSRIFVYQFGGVLKEGKYPDPYTWDHPYSGFKVGSLKKVDSYHKEFELSHEEQLQFMGNTTGSGEEMQFQDFESSSTGPAPVLTQVQKQKNCTMT